MDWILIYTAEDPSEALVARSLLESNGIEVREVKETKEKVFSLSMNGLVKIDLYVHEDQAEEAKKLLSTKTE
jgi:hypothetical protein